MIQVFSLAMIAASIIAAVLKAETTAAKAPGSTKLTIATAVAQAAINALAPKLISTQTAAQIDIYLIDAINGAVALMNVLGILKHAPTPP